VIYIARYFISVVGVQNIGMSMSVCMSTCISEKPHVIISTNLLYMLPVAVARSSSDSSAIHYLVLWMTSCFHIMEKMGQNQRRCLCFVLSNWQVMARGKVCRLPLHVVKKFEVC